MGIKSKVQPYKKDNTYRNMKKGAISASIILALAGSLYTIKKRNKGTTKGTTKETTKDTTKGTNTTKK